jgi:hypothetical protein
MARRVTKGRKTPLVIKLKRKAPKIPDFTCEHIDWVINNLEEYLNTTKEYKKRDHKKIVAKLEMLRTCNEQLRDSGRFWYDNFKQLVKEVPKLRYHKMGISRW